MKACHEPVVDPVSSKTAFFTNAALDLSNGMKTGKEDVSRLFVSAGLIL